MIEIDHGGGLMSLYGHMSDLLVAVGQLVKKGQEIGLVGSTGNSTGPHLHFGLYQDGQAIDPTSYAGFSNGTNMFKGGIARINEKMGELVTLPGGSQVLPHDKTVEISKAQGQANAYKEMLIRNANASNNNVPQSIDNGLHFAEGSITIQMNGNSDDDISNTARKLMVEMNRQKELKDMSIRRPIFRT